MIKNLRTITKLAIILAIVAQVKNENRKLWWKRNKPDSSIVKEDIGKIPKYEKPTASSLVTLGGKKINIKLKRPQFFG